MTQAPQTTFIVAVCTLLDAVPRNGASSLPTARVEVDGRVLEGKGIEPDVIVEDPLETSDGADPQLERALEETARGLRGPR